MAKVRELVGEMATIQMEYGESFWAALRPVQHARGLTATPHTIYDVNALGIEIGAHHLGSVSGPFAASDVSTVCVTQSWLSGLTAGTAVVPHTLR